MPHSKPSVEPDGSIDKAQVLEEAQALASLVGLVFVAAIVSLLFTLIGSVIPGLGMVFMALGYVIVAIGSGIVLMYIIARGMQLSVQ